MITKQNINKMNIKGIFIAIVPVAVTLLAFTGCSSPSGEITGNGVTSSDTEREEIVRVMELESREIARSLTYSANLGAYRKLYLAPASPGRIEQIHVDAGTNVSEGQLLVEMDRTQLQQALLQLENIEKEYRRLDTLIKAGSVSRQQYDQIKTQYEVALSNVEFLRENTRLHAPFTGNVSGRYFENGDMYTGTPVTQDGKSAVLSIVQTSRLKARVNISEKYYPDIHTGMPVTISSDVYPRNEFIATITRVFPTIDPMSRSFTVEMIISNGDERLRPGMFTRATIEYDQVEAIVVPAVAVLRVGGSNERFVFLEKNGKAQRVVVEIGDRFDDMVEIVSDEIHEGDNLIVAGQARLIDGVAVTVR